MSPSVAVVGAGAWGKNHVRAFHELGALGGVVETSPGLRQRLRLDFPGVPVWSCLEMAFDQVEGLVIATPAPSHAALAARALAAGLGVLVEKPMTLDTAMAETLVSLAETSGKPLMVGHLLLYQPAIQELKRQLELGLVGRVLRVHQHRLNLGQVRATENVLWSLAPHDVAVLLYLLDGPPETVSATGAAFLQPGITDDVHLELTFAGGRSAHIHACWYWPEKRRGLRVMGESGMVVYDEEDQSLVLQRRHLKGGPGPEGLGSVDRGPVRLFRGEGQALLREAQHFLACLASGAKPLSDGRSGVEVIRVLEAAEACLTKTPLEYAKESR